MDLEKLAGALLEIRESPFEYIKIATKDKSGPSMPKMRGGSVSSTGRKMFPTPMPVGKRMVKGEKKLKKKLKDMGTWKRRALIAGTMTAANVAGELMLPKGGNWVPKAVKKGAKAAKNIGTEWKKAPYQVKRRLHTGLARSLPWSAGAIGVGEILDPTQKVK